MTLPQFSDGDDRTNELLNAILREVSDWQAPEIDVAEGDQIVNQGDQVVNQGDVTNRSNQTVNQGDVYNSGGAGTNAVFSTGPTGIELEEAGMEDAQEIEMGFQAGTINIRTVAAIYVAFADPRTNPGRWIPVAAEESPFTIGGSNPIDVDRFWITQQDPEASEPAEVNVIAYR